MSFWAGLVQAVQEEDQKKFKREMFERELGARRQEALLNFALKKNTRSGSVSEKDKRKAAAGLVSIAKRLEGVEDKERVDAFIDSIAGDAEAILFVLDAVEKAEKKAAEEGNRRRIEGEEFMEAFSVVAVHGDNPEFKSKFNTTADYAEALLSINPEKFADDKVYADWMGEVQRLGEGGPSIRVETDFGALYETYNPVLADKAYEYVTNRSLQLAQQDYARMEEEGASVTDDDFRSLQRAIKDFNLGDFNAGTQHILQKYGALAYGEIADMDTYGDVSTYPRLNIFKDQWERQQELAQEIQTTVLETPIENYTEGTVAKDAEGNIRQLVGGEWIPLETQPEVPAEPAVEVPQRTPMRLAPTGTEEEVLDVSSPTTFGRPLGTIVKGMDGFRYERTTSGWTKID